MALSTVASAWCAFAAQRWAGVEAEMYSRADAARSETLRLNEEANRAFLLDFTVFLEYFSATLDGRPALANELYRRFLPDLKSATDVWLATNPWEAPEAALLPFELPEYQSGERTESARQAALADEFAAKAHEANDRTDNFLGLTVIFAVILFIGGVGSKFDVRGLRIASFVVALVLLLGVTVVIMVFSLE
jgi:hypothetical protein